MAGQFQVIKNGNVWILQKTWKKLLEILIENYNLNNIIIKINQWYTDPVDLYGETVKEAKRGGL